MAKPAKKLNPARRLIYMFLAFILCGTLLLMLPGMTEGSISFVDALFTAASAVCVTGLTVVETGDFFTLWGQIVILVLIQLGGLGYMSMASLIVVLMKKIHISGKLIVNQQLGMSDSKSLKKFILRVAALTFGMQIVGGLFLAFRMRDMFSTFSESLYFGFFHSISAFNNAGFDIFGSGVSLTPLRSDGFAVLTISILIITGGVGYIVLSDLWDNFKAAALKKRFRLTIHSKLVLSVTAILLALGTIAYYIAESANPATMAGMGMGQKWLMAFFQSVTARTAGFNMIDTAGLINFSIIFTIALMFIGASPGGTGGGIKTTTFSAVLLQVKAAFKSGTDINIFKRRMSDEILKKSVMIFSLSLIIITLSLLLISTSESFSIRDMLFEVFSAFGTVGLSTGITDSLSSFSKIIITITMFVGRLGPITVVAALLEGERRKKYRYPVQEIAVG
ncbi:MAG: TrkH family potassium uptake protein [Elusimicrobiota bacterium]